MSDAIVKEARDLGLYNSVTDNGAGGISCSVAEMAKESNGCYVQLDKVPLKYPGMAPWEIWISESQERMTLAVPKDKLEQFLDLMQRRGVEATVIGEFNDSGKCVVEYYGKKVMDIELDFLHDGLPEKHLKSTFTPQKHEEPKAECPNNLNKTLLEMMARPNVCSKEFISTQYDHAVQGVHAIGPVQGKGRMQGISSLSKIVLDSKKGVGLSQGVYPSYSDIDTYHMAGAGIDTAIRGLICLGVPLDRIALLDNFCWCSSTEPERLGQLKRAAKACHDYSLEFGTPLISGKDSMFNDFKGFDENNNPIKISVPPTLLVSSIGVIDDMTLAVSMDAKFTGDLVYAIGKTNEELGGSEYFAYLGFIGNKVPKLNAKRAKVSYKRFNRAIKKKLVASAYPVNYGGLGVALAKVSIAGKLGMGITLNTKMRADHHLFSESQGRIVATVNPKNKTEFEKIMGKHCELIGEVKGNHLVVKTDGREVLNVSLDELEKSYKKTFEGY
jgi:phosphoribosylformylglycinamidine synthase